MKKLIFEFTVNDDGGLHLTTSNYGIADGQAYACALVASRKCGKVLAKTMKQNGKSEFEVNAYFDKARDFAREFVDA